MDIEKLEMILLKLCSSLQKERERAIVVRQGTAVRRMPLEQVLYLEVMDRKIYLHTAEESIPFYGKLEELEPALSKASVSSHTPCGRESDTINSNLSSTFFRCHRSYIVNLRHVQFYNKGEIQLDNAETIPLSKRRYKSFGLAFMHYLKESGDVL